MSEAQPAVTTARLTPSETVLLHGDRFAGEAGMLRTGEELLGSGQKVAAGPLAEAALAAAVLGSEQAGGIRLEARAKKVLFGLMSRTTLYAEPAGSGGWPERTLEAEFRAKLGAGAREVDDVVYDLLERDTQSPASDTLDRVKRGLHGRDLLDREEVKKLKIFTTYRYRLPEATAALLRATPADPVRKLLDDCQRSRPEVWQLLVKHVKGALARRTEQSDSD